MPKTNDKLDIIIDKINDVEKVQIRQEQNLREHMRRTEILEDQMKPVSRHVTMVKGAIALIALLGTIAGIYRSLG